MDNVIIIACFILFFLFMSAIPTLIYVVNSMIIDVITGIIYTVMIIVLIIFSPVIILRKLHGLLPKKQAVSGA